VYNLIAELVFCPCARFFNKLKLRLINIELSAQKNETETKNSFKTVSQTVLSQFHVVLQTVLATDSSCRTSLTADMKSGSSVMTPARDTAPS